MKITYFMMLLITSMALIITSCGDDTGSTNNNTNNGGDNKTNKCENVNCTDGKVCDSSTGKCIDPCMGTICGEGQKPDPKNNCECKEVDLNSFDSIVKVRKHSSNLSQEEGIKGFMLEKSIEGVIVGVRGDSKKKNYSLVVQQSGATEFAGITINLTKIKGNKSLPDFKIGDIISFKGKVIEFYKRTQVEIANLEEITVKSSGAELPKAIDVTSETISEEKYESMYSYFSNCYFRRMLE